MEVPSRFPMFSTLSLIINEVISYEENYECYLTAFHKF